MKKADIKKPARPSRTVNVPALGGDVIVRGMLLAERLAYGAEIRPTINGASTYEHVAMLLARCVVDEDNQPIFTTAEWDEFGASYFDQAFDLFAAAQDVNGMRGEESAKK